MASGAVKSEPPVSDHSNRLHDALIAHELLKAVDECLADSTGIRLLNRLRMARDRARAKLEDYLSRVKPA